MKQDERKLNVRLPPELDKTFGKACIDREITKQAAAWEALRLWLAHGREVGAPSSEGVEDQHAKFPRTLDCPACKSLIQITSAEAPKVLEYGPGFSVSISEQRVKNRTSGVSSLREEVGPEETRCIEKLLYVLRQGQPATKVALLTNLATFENLTKISPEAGDEAPGNAQTALLEAVVAVVEAVYGPAEDEEVTEQDGGELAEKPGRRRPAKNRRVR